jgi:hypothetical protein
LYGAFSYPILARWTNIYHKAESPIWLTLDPPSTKSWQRQLVTSSLPGTVHERLTRKPLTSRLPWITIRLPWTVPPRKISRGRILQTTYPRLFTNRLPWSHIWLTLNCSQMAYPGGLGSRGNSQLTYPRLCTSDLLWIVPSYKSPSPPDLLSQTPYPELFSGIFIAEQAAAEGKRPGREIKKNPQKLKFLPHSPPHKWLTLTSQIP